MLGQVLLKVEKTSIKLFTENMTKGLYFSIVEKHLKEMETMEGKTLSW